MNMPLPKIPIGNAIEQAINYLTLHFAFITRAISHVVESGIDILVAGMLFFPPWLLILVFAGLSW